LAEILMKPYRRIWSLFKKELRTIAKDKMALVMIFLLPFVSMISLSIVVGQSAPPPGMGSTGGKVVGVLDLDTTTDFPGQDLSENYTAALREYGDFYIIMYNNESKAYWDLYNYKIDGYIVIPDGFEHNLTENIKTYVEVHVSATDLFTQMKVIAGVETANMMFRLHHGWIRSEILPYPIIEFQPKGDYTAAQFGGFICVFSSYLGITMTAAQAIVGDVPLRRMLLTPTTKMEVMIAKITAYLFLGFLQSIVLVALWINMFDISLNTDFLTLTIIMALSALSGSTTGILISTLSNSRLQANQAFLFLMFATLILSGFFIDVGELNNWLPMNLAKDILLSTAFKGLSLWDIGDKIIRLIIFCFASSLFSLIVFWRKEAIE